MQDPQVHPCSPGGSTEKPPRVVSRVWQRSKAGFLGGRRQISSPSFHPAICPGNTLQSQAFLLPHRPPPLPGKPGVAAEFPCLGVRYVPVLQHRPAGDAGVLPGSSGLLPRHPAALFPGLSLRHGQAKNLSSLKLLPLPADEPWLRGGLQPAGGSPLGWWHLHLPGVRNGVVTPSSHGA